ncbi:hypothetical protein ABZ354_02425 [Streptomyces sp. NPDC005925]|uniref:hypothetical protein n=1 Tax=Streptomyces sp. NPDC005925 TaxID=3157172 RepID=UPI0033CD7651
MPRSTAAGHGPPAGTGDEAATGTDGQPAAVHRLGRDAAGRRTVDGTASAGLPPAAFDTPTRRREDADATVAVASRTGNRPRPVTGGPAAAPAHATGESVGLTGLEELADLVHRLVTRFAEDRPTLTQGTTG